MNLKQWYLKTRTSSHFFTLNWFDIFNGALVAAAGGAVTAIEACITSLTVDWKNIASVASAAAAGYLLKRLFTPAQTISTVSPNKSEN